MDEAIQAAEGGERETLLTIIYENGVDERVMNLLADLSIEGWTKLSSAHGFGGTGYKLDSPIWPGENSVLLIALPEARAVEIAAALRALQQTYRRKPGITMWMQPITML